ncbi:MAG: cell division topological specificity factor MinE [Deltaproteobacteria bacterium]|nr:cell division topological specificity factor MinE [Deltaproteobacteria bacterium]
MMIDFFDLFRPKKSSAKTAKERLLIVVSHERQQRSGYDFLPQLREELLAVVRKYVAVQPDDILVDFHKEEGREVMRLNVAIPDSGKKT